MPSGPTGATAFDPRQQRHEVEKRLHEEMLAARREFDRAAEAYKALARMPSGGNTTTWRSSLEIAQEARQAAYERYATALKRFTELVIDGKPPEGVQ